MTPIWINALRLAAQPDPRWAGPLQLGLDSFHQRFWNPSRQMLFDEVNVGHQPGVNNGSLRPNQIFAVGEALWIDQVVLAPSHPLLASLRPSDHVLRRQSNAPTAIDPDRPSATPNPAAARSRRRSLAAPVPAAP